MIWLSVIGIIVNFLAAYKTREGDSLNQKAVNLHMLEDVLNWVVVFIGSIIMKFTDITYIDSVMSIGIALFLLKQALGNLKNILNLFLAKVPNTLRVEEIKKEILKIPRVEDVHHIHIWSMDGVHHYATMHVVVLKDNDFALKNKIKDKLKEMGISHSTLEMETCEEECREESCEVRPVSSGHHHHHDKGGEKL